MNSILTYSAGAVLLIIGIITIALEELWYGVGLILIAILILPVTFILLRKCLPDLFSNRNKWIAASVIGLAIIISALSFGRKTYYEQEPQYSELSTPLSKHAVYQTKLSNGMNYAYLEKGNGPVVVLLHGFPDITLVARLHQFQTIEQAYY